MQKVKKEIVSYTKPSITELEIDFVTDAIKNGWGENCYQYINKFEEEFSSYLGVKHTIATSSCTGALHMGLYALGIGPGDEVIIANTNWVASAAPIIHLGATPIFVDIDPLTWCIASDTVEAAITTRTKAIIAVHLYGNLCDLNKLNEIGQKYSISIIEDAAEAIGSVYFGSKAGSLGRFGTFSLHGTKTLTTGEGGLFVTNDSDLFERVLTLSNHGRSRKQKKQFWPDEVGFKYKMGNLQAALGCAQLLRIEELISEKRSIFKFYESKLHDLPIIMNVEKEGCKNGFWMPTVVFNKEFPFNRDELTKIYKNNNIDSRVFFWPLSQTNISGKKAFNSPYISEEIHLRGINLPSPFGISKENLILITEILRDYVLGVKNK